MTAPTIDTAHLALQLTALANSLRAVHAEVEDATPDGHELALTVSATLGTVVDALPLAIEAIRTAPLYVALDTQVADLVDCAPTVYTFTRTELAARDERIHAEAWEDGWNAHALDLTEASS